MTYWQPGNLNEAIRVALLKLPVLGMYSVVYQKVQSSAGSTLMLLQSPQRCGLPICDAVVEAERDSQRSVY